MIKAIITWLYKVLIDPWLQPASKFVARDAVVFALRPNAEGANIVIASGKTKFVLRGAPSHHQGYISCDSANAIETSALETPALTMIFVARIKQVAGSWQAFVGGTYNNTRGVSVFHNPRGIIYQEIASVSDIQVNRIEVIAPLQVDEQDPTLSQWAFLAVTVDPVSQQSAYFTTSTPYTQIDQVALGRDLHQREIEEGRQMVIGTVLAPNPTSYPAQTHIAEALYFDRALTQEEIAQQYAYSKAYHALNGITI